MIPTENCATGDVAQKLAQCDKEREAATLSPLCWTAGTLKRRHSMFDRARHFFFQSRLQPERVEIDVFGLTVSALVLANSGANEPPVVSAFLWADVRSMEVHLEMSEEVVAFAFVVIGLDLESKFGESIWLRHKDAADADAFLAKARALQSI